MMDVMDTFYEDALPTTAGPSASGSGSGSSFDIDFLNEAERPMVAPAPIPVQGHSVPRLGGRSPPQPNRAVVPTNRRRTAGSMDVDDDDEEDMEDDDSQRPPAKARKQHEGAVASASGSSSNAGGASGSNGSINGGSSTGGRIADSLIPSSYKLNDDIIRINPNKDLVLGMRRGEAIQLQKTINSFAGGNEHVLPIALGFNKNAFGMYISTAASTYGQRTEIKHNVFCHVNCPLQNLVLWFAKGEIVGGMDVVTDDTVSYVFIHIPNIEAPEMFYTFSANPVLDENRVQADQPMEVVSTHVGRLHKEEVDLFRFSYNERRRITLDTETWYPRFGKIYKSMRDDLEEAIADKGRIVKITIGPEENVMTLINSEHATDFPILSSQSQRNVPMPRNVETIKIQVHADLLFPVFKAARHNGCDKMVTIIFPQNSPPGNSSAQQNEDGVRPIREGNLILAYKNQLNGVMETVICTFAKKPDE